MDSVTQSELENFLEPDADSPCEPEMDLTGIIFHPTDQDIITILEYKRSHPDIDVLSPIFVAKIYEHEPSGLPGLPAVQTGGKWWNFFCEPIPLDASGERFWRSTRTGYWKATGNPSKIKAKRTHQEIGEKRTLVFHERSRGGSKGRSKEVRTNWVMHEYSAKPNPLFQKDYVVCRIKLKKEKKPRVSTKNESKRAKKSLISTNDENRPKRRTSTKKENKQAKKRLTSTNDEGQSGNYVTVDNENQKSPLELQPLSNCYLNPSSISHDVGETISPQPQLLLPSCNSISDSRSDAVQNTYPPVSNSNNHAIEDTLQLDPLPLQNPNALDGSTRLDQASLSTLQSRILPEQNENDGLNYPFGPDWDFLEPLAPGEFLHQDLYQLLVTPTY